MEFIPFSEELLLQAAELVAHRQRELRVGHSLLPEKYEQPEAALTAVKRAWQMKKASGVAAVSDEKLLGYVFGDVTSDKLRGRAIWIRPAGHCVAKSHSRDLIRDLYANAAPSWLELQGCYSHFAMSFAAPELLRCWEDLAFAREQAYALNSLDASAAATNVPSGLDIRRATAADSEIFRQMSTIISGTQSQSPSWVPALPENVESMSEGYAGVPGDDDAICWLAKLNDEPVGFVAFFPPSKQGLELFVPENSVELTIAGTLSKAQGLGVGTALVDHAREQLYLRGYRVCMIDWHIPNLLSSRFWPKRGFVPHICRMKRVVDPRILDAQVEIP